MGAPAYLVRLPQTTGDEGLDCIFALKAEGSEVIVDIANSLGRLRDTRVKGCQGVLGASQKQEVDGCQRMFGSNGRWARPTNASISGSSATRSESSSYSGDPPLR